MRCPKCQTVVPHGAKYCPRCGARAEPGPAKPPMAAGAIPSNAPIPHVGRLFIVATVVGLFLLLLGLGTGAFPAAWIGGAILAVVIVALIVGHHVS